MTILDVAVYKEMSYKIGKNSLEHSAQYYHWDETVTTSFGLETTQLCCVIFPTPYGDVSVDFSVLCRQQPVLI